MTELFPVQKLCATKLAAAIRKFGAAGNWSATGTGKTLVALEVARLLETRPLVVAPLAAHATWERWSRELNVPVLGIVNLERLRTGKTPFVSRTGTAKKPMFHWSEDLGFVVIDEIHRGLLGRDSAAGRMAAMLKVQSIPVLLMSATPYSSPLDMRHTGYILGCHRWDLAAFYTFCRANGCRESWAHRGLEFPVDSPDGRRWLKEIAEKLQKQATKLETNDLEDQFGDLIVEPCLVSLDERHRAEIDRIYREMDEAVKSPTGNPLVDRLRARQHAELLKLPAMAELAEDAVAEGLSVYVALGFKASVRELAALLSRLDPVLVHGDMPPGERDRSVEAFQADRSPVLVATAAAGGASISLHREREAQRNRTALLSPMDSASETLQALGRIHRAGGAQKTVLQRLVLAAGTVEEKVARRLEAKARNIRTLTDSDLSIA
jgi:hypothetical protein